jgi:hypothetical protein
MSNSALLAPLWTYSSPSKYQLMIIVKVLPHKCDPARNGALPVVNGQRQCLIRARARIRIRYLGLSYVAVKPYCVLFPTTNYELRTTYSSRGQQTPAWVPETGLA